MPQNSHLQMGAPYFHHHLLQSAGLAPEDPVGCVGVDFRIIDFINLMEIFQAVDICKVVDQHLI